MPTINTVYIATSLDGYIADRNDGIAWLESIVIPADIDLGYADLMHRVDAMIMGRNTFETVCGLGVEWPYTCPVFVLSNTLITLPSQYEGKAKIIKGPLQEICTNLEKQGYKRLYIDGGATIQSFLREDLVDELIITTFPILLGGGPKLFGDLPKELTLKLESSKVFLGALVQSHYSRPF